MTQEQQPGSTIQIGTVGETKHQFEASVSTTFELKGTPPSPPSKEGEKGKRILAIASARYPVHPGYDFANPVAQQMYWLLKRYEEKHPVTVVCKEGSKFKDVIYFVGNDERVAAAEIKNLVKFDEYDLIVDFSDQKWSYQQAKKVQTLYVMNPQLEYRTAPPGLKHPCLVGVSDVHCSHLSAELGMPVRKLPFGYEPPVDGTPARDDKNYLLYFGKIVKEKGVHELITICRKRRIDLIIAGDDRWEMGIEQSYVHRILEECDGHSIQYVGAVDENVKAKLIAEAHAVVIPYLTDFNAYGCLTARATNVLRVPIVAVNRGAVEEFIRPGVNGAYCMNIEELEMFDFEHLTMAFDGYHSAPDYERFEQLVERALRSPW